MPVSLKSSTLPALVLEIAERLRVVEAALTPAQNRVSISYGSSLSDPRTITISATLPVTKSRVSADGGSKFLYSDYAPVDSLDLTGTPLDGMAVESLAEALGVAIEDLYTAEQAKIAANGTIPNGVGTDITLTPTQASINCSLAYTVAFATNGATQMVVTNHAA